MGRSDDGRRPGDLAFVRAVVGTVAASGWRLADVLEVNGAERAALVVVSNDAVFTYAGGTALRFSPEARFELGLDYAALASPGALRIAPRFAPRCARAGLAGLPGVIVRPRPRPDRGRVRPAAAAAGRRRGSRRRRRGGVRVRARRGLGAGLAARPRSLLAAAAAAARARPPRSRTTARSQFRFADRGIVNHDYPIGSTTSPTRARAAGASTPTSSCRPGKGPFPAVIWAHGSGGTRDDLILPATWLAARGAVSLVVDDPFERDPQLDSPPTRSQRAAIVQQVIDLRRGVDLLQSRPRRRPEADRVHAA